MKGLYFPAHTCNSHLLAMLRNVSKWDFYRTGTVLTPYHPYTDCQNPGWDPFGRSRVP